jgi:pimeloyl-ACP methyl ester carboxylesterase
MTTLRAVAGALTAAALATIGLASCSGGSTGPVSPSAGAGSATSGQAASAGAAAAAGARGVRWHSCPAALSTGSPGTGVLRCGQLKVPLNYQQPGGRTITLALSELPATAPAGKQQGVLLVNPGGPGGSGLSLPSQVAGVLPSGVAADYDIVGFDTRGVGSSVPALTCDPSFFSRPRPDYVPAGPAAEQVLIDRAKAYAADCQKRFGWLLPYMTTADLARDMDSVRAALGRQQVSYLGYSYGTYLGQVYATMFPSRIRRMVLDSIVDPAGVWYADNIAQDYAFQGRLNAFFAWAAANNRAFGLGATAAQVRRAYAQASSRLAAHPAGTSAGPLVGPDELSDTFLVGGYATDVWPDLATSLSSYLHQGSAAELISLYQAAGKQGENEFAVYNAVECSDAAWPRDWAKWNADTRKVYAAAPFEAWGNAWFNAACAFWPVKGPARPAHIDGAGLPPILLLQGTLDAATPYQGALDARRLLPSARLVVVQGGGNHGQSLTTPPNPCVLGYLGRYLGNGTLPGSSGLVSATCPAQPAPAP